MGEYSHGAIYWLVHSFTAAEMVVSSSKHFFFSVLCPVMVHNFETVVAQKQKNYVSWNKRESSLELLYIFVFAERKNCY